MSVHLLTCVPMTYAQVQRETIPGSRDGEQGTQPLEDAAATHHTSNLISILSPNTLFAC